MSKKRRRPVQRTADQRRHAASKAEDEKEGQAHQQPVTERRWQMLQRVFAVLGAVSTLAGMVAVGNGLMNHFVTSSESYKRGQEEVLVGRLVPGQDWLRIVQIMGSTPDYRGELPSRNTLFQYHRQWEDLQLLVDPHGRVLSVGVYAITTDFHPTLRLGGYPLTLNRSPVVFPQQQPAAASGYCGAHKAGYFEAYYPMPNAYGAQNLVSGVSDATTTSVSVHDVCRIAEMCPIFLEDNQVSTEYVDCVRGSPEASRLRSHLIASVLIVTAPAQDVVRDMLWPPDDAINLVAQPSP